MPVLRWAGGSALVVIFLASTGLQAKSLQPGSGTVRSPDPVMQVSFDDSFDMAGSNRVAAEMVGDEVERVPGVVGQCVFIGGTGDWIDYPVGVTVDLNGGATLEFWVKRDDWENPYKGGSGWQSLVSVGGLTTEISAPGCPLHKPWAFEASVTRSDPNTGKTRQYCRLNSDSSMCRPKVWYHVGLVHDPSNRQAILYINGQPVARTNRAPDSVVEKTRHMRVGTWYMTNQAFRGWIDEIRLYDYPRSESQIRDSYQERKVMGQTP